MRRDILFASLGVLTASFFMFSTYYKASASYRKFDVSPLLYKHDILPVDKRRVYRGPPDAELLEKPIVYRPKYSVSFDLSGTKEAGGTEKYMELPLETDGKTADTDSLYEYIDEVPIEDPTFIKYIKFQFISSRNSDVLEVKVGGFKFLQGRSPASTKPITMLNPHTGKSEKYCGG